MSKRMMLRWHSFYAAFSVALCSAVLGCGRSPLLNHDDEAPQVRSQTQVNTSTDTNKCRLHWNVAAGTLCASTSWLLPPIVGENRIRIVFQEPLGAVVVSAAADMPSMGHGTAPIRVVRIDEHTVDLEEVWLIMNGVWFVRVTIDGVEASWSIEL